MFADCISPFYRDGLPVLHGRKEMQQRREHGISETVVAADELICRSQENSWIVIMYYLMYLVVY